MTSAQCDSTYRKVHIQVVGRLDFELWGCKVKISQNIVPKSILRFHILWNLQYLILKLLEGFGAKTVFSCQNWPLNCQNTNTLYRFTNFKSLFSKSTFQKSVMTSSIKLPYFKNAMSDFKHFCTKIEMKEQPYLGSSKKSILIFWDNWSLSMCWDNYFVGNIFLYSLYHYYRPLMILKLLRFVNYTIIVW